MAEIKRIQGALISVFCKDGIAEIAKVLSDFGVKIYSTGGTLSFLEKSGFAVQSVESLTGYPSILGGRVKTLHPKVFGGILARRDNAQDAQQLAEYEIPAIDLVITDLYPFEDTVKSGASTDEIVEKIDIGGVSLIRAAAKNFADVAVVAAREQYTILLQMLQFNKGGTTLEERRWLATQAFNVTSHYDTAIFNYFNEYGAVQAVKQSYLTSTPLRYGENPHQQAAFYGDLSQILEQLHGKEISYNNLLDIDAAVRLIADFNDSKDATFAILKHNNACGIATRPTLLEAWTTALACDPLSAFGGVLICNRSVDKNTAEEVGKLFCEVLIAPDYEDGALDILKQKKNRILLKIKDLQLPVWQSRTLLNGLVQQTADEATEGAEQLHPVTLTAPTKEQIQDLIFANKIVKHSKSNAIVLASQQRLLASGVGQTSRIDALQQAIDKAGRFGFSVQGAVLASDAFFPFADCAEAAHKAGIAAIVQPGGSLRDQDSIDYCNANKVAMVFTGIRHFKH
ncbi:bifunctional purine biosynthesis protein PurH [Bacteroidia bacterium]|nr:bifunctional purine biosynthesis protein PurH [Bacteroidia bacterium]